MHPLFGLEKLLQIQRCTSSDMRKLEAGNKVVHLTLKQMVSDG